MLLSNQNQRFAFLVRAAGQAGLASGAEAARRHTPAKHPYAVKRPSDSTVCGLGRSDQYSVL